MKTLHIHDDVLKKWQAVVDTMARLINVPAGLVMRVSGPDIEVFVASEGADNPYTPGAKETLLGSGLYCETVIKTKQRLLIPNALQDEAWQNNPDVALNMISYLGYPLILPTGDVFGTICVLDSQTNHYSESYQELVSQFKELIESHLALMYQNQQLAALNHQLKTQMAEIKTLRNILPICTFCKKIRDDTGFWQAVDEYVTQHTDTQFSHGLCPNCMVEHYPDVE
jgi:GAF domain-containing protein